VFQVDLGAAQDRIERLEIGPVHRSLDEAIEQGVRLLEESDKQRKEIYLFTDLTRSAWQEATPETVQRLLDPLPDAAIYVVDVGSEKPANFFLGDVNLSGQVLAESSPLLVTSAVACLGDGGERVVQLYLGRLDEPTPPQKRDEEIVVLEPGESKQIELAVSGLAAGTYQGMLRLVGSDGLEVDDRRYFTIEVEPAWKVLVAAPRPADDSTRYFVEAIAPLRFRKTNRARFQCEVIDQAGLKEQPLERYAAVCLLDPAPLPTDVWQRLADYAATGGSVALVLGQNARPMNALNEEAPQELLPGRLMQQGRSPDGELTLAPRAMDHPLLKKFALLESSVPWADFPVFRYWQFEGLVPQTVTIIPFSNGQPALVERPVGEGRVLTMTTPLSDLGYRDPWNLLTRGEAWPFFMLANEMALYLVGSGEAKVNYRCGETVVLRFNPDSALSNYVLLSPDGEPLRRTADRRQNAVVVSETQSPGHYSVHAGGGEDRFQRGFSVNYASADTDLDRMPRDEFDALFGKRMFHFARNQDEIAQRVRNVRIGSEFYPWLICLVALLLGMEHLVSNRFYRDDGTDSETGPKSSQQSGGVLESIG
jgi:hypothetical protein